MRDWLQPHRVVLIGLAVALVLARSSFLRACAFHFSASACQSTVSVWAGASVAGSPVSGGGAPLRGGIYAVGTAAQPQRS